MIVKESFCENCPVGFEWVSSGRKGEDPCHNNCNVTEALIKTQEAYESLYNRFEQEAFKLGTAEVLIGDLLDDLTDINKKIEKMKKDIEYFNNEHWK